MSQREYSNSINCKKEKHCYSLEEQKYLLEIYKSFSAYVTAVTVRRWQQNAVTLVLLMALATLYFNFIDKRHYLIACIFACAGIIIALIWYKNLINSKKSLGVKYGILQGMEVDLPYQPFITDGREMEDKVKTSISYETGTAQCFLGLFILLSSYACYSLYKASPG